MSPLVALTLLAVACAKPAAAECRIALALAIDVSHSVDATDYEIQRNGLIDALADPQVKAAFLGPKNYVTLAVFEWAGRDYQDLIVDWTEIRSARDLDSVANRVAAQQQVSQHLPTALGWALDFGHRLFESAPPCGRRVLDVSGDGRNNFGKTPKDVFRTLDFADIVINGLAIGQHESDLTTYYRNELIRGPGAFVETARHQSDYPAVMRRKLIRELGDLVAGIGPGTMTAGG